MIRYYPRLKVCSGWCDNVWRSYCNFMAAISDHGRSQHHLILLWPLNSMTCSFQLDHRPPSKTVRSKHCLCSHIFPEGDEGRMGNYTPNMLGFTRTGRNNSPRRCQSGVRRKDVPRSSGAGPGTVFCAQAILSFALGTLFLQFIFMGFMLTLWWCQRP